MNTPDIKAEALKTAELFALGEMQRVKAWKPYRIVWCAIHPETLEYTGAFASTTKHGINSHLRKGYRVYTV